MVLSTFPCFEIVEKCEKKHVEKTWKIDGKSMEKPAENGDLHRGIKKDVVFYFFFAPKATPGKFRGPPGVATFHVFLIRQAVEKRAQNPTRTGAGLTANLQ